MTGGIASGKSTVRALFERLGCHTIDADELVAELYEPGGAGHGALRATYGDRVLREDGTVDRVKLAAIAFSGPEEARKLNGLIHPIVIRTTEERIEAFARAGGDGIAVVEATLMIESGGRERYHRIIVVDVEPAVQIARGVARGLTRDEVLRRIANQIAREERLRQADYVIDNSGDTESLSRETRRVHGLLLADLEAMRRVGG